MSSGLIALGIDLGTTYSVAATMIMDARNYWYPKILSNPGGKDLTPSVVFFDASDKTSIVGNDALQLWRSDPRNVVRWVKRRMGESNFSYEINENTKLSYFTPQQISSLILTYIVRYSLQRATDLELKSVVITIPAFFGDNERQATIDAAKLLNLDVILIEEPTAAILDYLHEKINENSINYTQGNKFYAVFDLGGGTFDISIAQLTWENQNPIIRIIATEGHRKLGGFDFDLDLTEYVINKFKDKYPKNIDKFNLLLSSLDELRSSGYVKDVDTWKCLVDVIDIIESAKIFLSTVNTRRVYMPPGNYFSEIMHIDLTRSELEQTLGPWLIEIENRINQSLITAKKNTDDELDSWSKLERVIMVGGSTRIPYIRDLVSRVFGKEPALDGREDHSVARGAAIYAGIIAGFNIQGKFQRKTVHSYGVFGNNGFVPIIKRGTAYPPATAETKLSVAFSLSPNLKFEVVQGVSNSHGKEDFEVIKDIAYYHPVLYTGDTISINLTIDQNGLLQISAEDNYGEKVEEKVQGVALSDSDKEEQQKNVSSWPLRSDGE